MAMKVELGASLGAGSNPGEDIGMMNLHNCHLKAVNISQKTPVPRGRYQCPPKITLTLKYVNRGIKALQIHANPCSLLMPPMPILVLSFVLPQKIDLLIIPFTFSLQSKAGNSIGHTRLLVNQQGT
jgi:hypothetical protein